jgi:hypothetical protein
MLTLYGIACTATNASESKLLSLQGFSSCFLLDARPADLVASASVHDTAALFLLIG